MHPTLGNGKICYLGIPTGDIARSAEFYQRVFGWRVRRREDGSAAFDDGVGEVSGTWVLGRAPAADAGLLIYIMVDDAAAVVEAIRAGGGEIVQTIDPGSEDVTATFRDPGGNLMGILQRRGQSASAAGQVEIR